MKFLLKRFTKAFKLIVAVFLLKFQTMSQMKRRAAIMMHKKGFRKDPDRSPRYTGNPQYPNEWFEANLNHKPTLNVPKTSMTFDELRETVAYGIKRKNLSCAAARAYLFALMENNAEFLDEEWISFGREIGTSGSIITVANLVDVNKSEEDVRQQRMLGMLAKDDQWLVLYLCAVYCIIDKKDDVGRAKVVDSVKRQLKEKNAPYYANAEHIFDCYANWKYDKWYTALMAAMDMFFVRFPNNNFAYARIGTMVSRFRHCAALNGLLYMKEVSGLDFSEIRQWIWSEVLVKEFEAIIRPDNEIDDEYSYMPYFMDLNLSLKSPYSSTFSPNFHLWMHTAGCCLGFSRSIHSRMVGSPDKEIVPKLGIIFGCAMKMVLKKFRKATAPEIGIPNNLRGSEWLIWFKNQNRQLNVDVIKIIQTVFKTFEEARDDTIGKFLNTFEF